MRPETPEIRQPLRYGYTTGACATAASLAAVAHLLAGLEPDQVRITLPRGQSALFRLAYCRLTATGAEVAVVKDAGDDPDVTHGALITAQVTLRAALGIDGEAEIVADPVRRREKAGEDRGVRGQGERHFGEGAFEEETVAHQPIDRRRLEVSSS